MFCKATKWNIFLWKVCLFALMKVHSTMNIKTFQHQVRGLNRETTLQPLMLNICLNLEVAETQQ